MFLCWYKKKVVGPFKEEPTDDQKQFIRSFIDKGKLSLLPDVELPEAEDDDFVIITNDEETKRKLTPSQA